MHWVHSNIDVLAVHNGLTQGASAPYLLMSSYSIKILKANNDADNSLLGVRLGNLCINKDIPVHTIATSLGVSKSVVYRWFIGKHDISKHLRDKVEKYYDAIPR